MSDELPYAGPDEAPLALDEIVDRAGRRVASALVAAGALIGLAIYWQPAPPRYQAVANGTEVLRIDTRKGTILSCTGDRCYTVVRHGQHLDSGPPASLPKPAAQLPAAPAPGSAPAAAAAPAH
jgi:hypothetical protein